MNADTAHAIDRLPRYVVIFYLFFKLWKKIFILGIKDIGVVSGRRQIDLDHILAEERAVRNDVDIVEEGVEGDLLMDANVLLCVAYVYQPPHWSLSESKSGKRALSSRPFRQCQEMEIGRRRSSMQGLCWDPRPTRVSD